MTKVDLPAFEKQLRDIFVNKSVNSKYIFNEHTDRFHRNVFVLRGEYFLFEFIIGPRWIGYDLNVKGTKKLLSTGTFEDTDNYGIYGPRNEEIAVSIFNNGIKLLNLLFDGEVLYSQGIKASMIAIKIDDQKYLVKTGKKALFGFLSLTEDELTAEEVGGIDFKILT